MELGENWHVNAPWAQLVASTKMPDELFKYIKYDHELYNFILQCDS